MHLKTNACSEAVSLMNGSVSLCNEVCVVDLCIGQMIVRLSCLVSDLLFDYDILFGYDGIRLLGGVKFNDNGNVEFLRNDTAAVVLSTHIDDNDFQADFTGGHWTVKWKWREENRAPMLSNTVSEYKVKEYESEIAEWISQGWLKEYDGEHDGVIPLMAVIQENKAKVRPVMDYGELNQYVSSHTADSEICNQKLRNWRKLGNNVFILDLKKAYLQIHVHPDLYKYQVVVHKGKRYCLTRLGFGLNCAPRIMSSILKKVFSMDPVVEAGVDSYIDDIIVNADVVSCEKVISLLDQFGLESKPPVPLDGARVLGLKVAKEGCSIRWKRDNAVPDFGTVSSKRQLFSLCGKLLGHYPVAGWLRPACSYVKRLTNGTSWDAPVDDAVLLVLRDLEKRFASSDPVGGIWTVNSRSMITVWCDASSIATSVVLESHGKVIEDGCWLRKENDPAHINVAELEAVIKGVNLALEWGFREMQICTDSGSVYGWLRNMIDGDRPIHVSGISAVLIKRRLQLLADLFKELDVSVLVRHVTSQKNPADALTRVPHKWLKPDVVLAGITQDMSELIAETHSHYHQGVKKTLHLCRKRYPRFGINEQMVQKVVKSCEKCRKIDPQPVKVEEGSLSADTNWERLACDVTHYRSRKYLSIIDCEPSRFAIWKPIMTESAAEVSELIQSVFREMGPPSEILLDNFSSFKSKIFLGMLNQWKVNSLFRCAYRPEGNAIVERNHRTVKRMAARSGGNVLDMVHGYNITPQQNDLSPSDQIFRKSWRWLFVESNKSSPSSSFQIGDAVFVKPPNSRCFNEWQRGKVTGINSQWNIEVDGTPRHVKDIRRDVPKETVELDSGQDIPTQREGRPQRQEDARSS